VLPLHKVGGPPSCVHGCHDALGVLRQAGREGESLIRSFNRGAASGCRARRCAVRNQAVHHVGCPLARGAQRGRDALAVGVHARRKGALARALGCSQRSGARRVAHADHVRHALVQRRLGRLLSIKISSIRMRCERESIDLILRKITVRNMHHMMMHRTHARLFQLPLGLLALRLAAVRLGVQSLGGRAALGGRARRAAHRGREGALRQLSRVALSLRHRLIPPRLRELSPRKK